MKDTAKAAYWSIRANIQPGSAQYGDRTNVLTSMPSSLSGSAWIRAANGSKLYTGNPIVTFAVSRQANVYVAVDTRLGKRPWMDSTWSDTGTSIVNNESPPTTFELYKMTFPPGQVALGPNAGIDLSSMYTIIVQS